MKMWEHLQVFTLEMLDLDSSHTPSKNLQSNNGDGNAQRTAAHGKLQSCAYVCLTRPAELWMRMVKGIRRSLAGN